MASSLRKRAGGSAAWLKTHVPLRVWLVLAAIALLFGLLWGIDRILGASAHPTESAPFVYGAVAVISLLPVLFILVDVLAANRGALEVGGIKVDFSQAAEAAPPSVSVPSSLGVVGKSVTDSDTTSIVKALDDASASEIAVVPLEDGQAWWETRLLVLAAGAARRDRPRAIVFTATESTSTGQFVGWATPTDVLRILLGRDPRYQAAHARADAIASQWRLVEPGQPGPAGGLNPLPMFQLGASNFFAIMGFRPDGSRNPFAFEQMLQHLLGQEIEEKGGTVQMTASLTRQVFAPVLHSEAMEESASPSRQVDALLSAAGDYVALTRERTYLRLLPRVTGLAIVLRSIGGLDRAERSPS